MTSASTTSPSSTRGRADASRRPTASPAATGGSTPPRLHHYLTLTPINDMDLPTAALVYAGIGWPVLPLKAANKTPLTTHGLLDASAEPEAIFEWWARWPDANIGLRTGLAFDVLDLDGPAGVASAKTLDPNYKHAGPIAKTGKGLHLLFEPTGAKNAAKARDGLDFRGVNGYIVAPPSLHPLGHQYQWARNGILGPAPTWLTEVIFPPPPVRTREPDPAISESLARTDIVSTFVDMLHAVLRPIGSRFITTCPFHDDSTPSCVLYPETQSFFCFGCRAWGDALNVANYIRTGALR